MSSSVYTPVSLTASTLLGDRKVKVIGAASAVIFDQSKTSTLGSSTHTTPSSTSLISKPKESINTDVSKDCSPTFNHQ